MGGVNDAGRMHALTRRRACGVGYIVVCEWREYVGVESERRGERTDEG